MYQEADLFELAKLSAVLELGNEFAWPGAAESRARRGEADAGPGVNS